MPIDPCREWLGIDAVDLASPHLVLAVGADETDPGSIERAAEERLRTLRAISPGPFERARAALVTRVGEARDQMLESVRRAAAQPRPELPRGGLAPPPPPLSSSKAPAWPAAVAAPPPLAPPPVPTASDASGGAPAVATESPESAADAGRLSSGFADAAETALVVGRRGRPRRSADSGWIVATIMSLVAVAAALVAFVVVSGQERGRRVAARGSERPRITREEPITPARRPDHSTPRPPDSPEKLRDEPASREPAPQPVEEPAPKEPTPDVPAWKDPTPDVPVTKDPAPDEPAPNDPTPDEPAPNDPTPEEPTTDPAADPAAVEKALKNAYAEIRAGRFAAAEKAVDEASAAAADDLTAGRVERWRLLVTYARQLAEYRDTALAEAAKGGDYTVGGRVISVVEMNKTQFVYKDRGEMKRPRRDAIPPQIVLAILSTWFAGDGRPANDIYLGVQHLVGGEPDLDAARAAWRRAGQGGEEVAPLVGLLADPVLRGGP
jgi:hypothetical protein